MSSHNFMDTISRGIFNTNIFYMQYLQRDDSRPFLDGMYCHFDLGCGISFVRTTDCMVDPHLDELRA